MAKHNKHNSGNLCGKDIDSKSKTAKKKLRKPQLGIKINSSESIELSKQLAVKVKKNESVRAKLTRTKACNKSMREETRMCGNGKAMPSLAELEKMYEDSDDDCQENNQTLDNPATIQQCINIEDEPSPETVKNVASKMMNILSNICNATSILVNDDSPPLPIIPQKRNKKSGIPYIVGCKDRPQLKTKPTVNFCKGDEDYGVDYNVCDSDNEDLCPKKRRKKRSNMPNFSKSKFNAQSDDIASKLKETEDLCENSSDSNKTVSYDFSNTEVICRSFSPLPSTSKDDATFLKNVERFNESLICDNVSNMNSENDVDIIDIPCETILIDDDRILEKTETYKERNFDDCEIIENPATEQNKKLGKNDLGKLTGDYYSSIALSEDDLNYDPSECEIVDVDDVIAENKAIINKYSYKHNPLTIVDSGAINSNSMEIASVGNNHNNITNPPSATKKIIEEIVMNFFSKHLGNDFGNRKLHDQLKVNNLGYQNNHKKIKELVSKLKYVPRVENTTSMNVVEEDVNNVVTSSPQYSIPRTTCVCSVHNNCGSSRHRNHLNRHAPGLAFETIHNPSVQRPIYSEEDRASHISHILSQIYGPRESNERVSSTTVNKDQGRQHKKAKKAKQHDIVIPVKETVHEEGTRRIGDCPICLENLTTKAAASTICGHIFCMDCIKVALKSTGKRCPSCRKVLKGVGYHQLFL